MQFLFILYIWEKKGFAKRGLHSYYLASTNDTIVLRITFKISLQSKKELIFFT